MIASEAQNTPRMGKPAAQGKAPNKTKTRRTGGKLTTTARDHHGLAVVDTTGRGGCHGLTVVAAHGRGGSFSPGCAVSLFACLFVVRRFLLFSFFKLPCIWTFRESEFIP